MYRLQVLRQQVCVSPRHLKRPVASTLLQMEHTSATVEVVDCECVTEGVQGSRCSKTKLSAQNLDSPEGRHTPHRCIVACGKEQVIRFSLKVCNEAMQGFAQYERKME